MWILTPIGFFSIVRKPQDEFGNLLTVRARVREDLEAFARRCPELGPIETSEWTDYAFRARIYGEVWDTLYGLQRRGR